jgi:hypothetical protein
MNIIVGTSSSPPATPAQYAAYEPDNDAKRKARPKVKRSASGDHLRVLKWIGDLEKDRYAERRKQRRRKQLCSLRQAQTSE